MDNIILEWFGSLGKVFLAQPLDLEAYFLFISLNLAIFFGVERISFLSG